jgi:hypothetical protein
LLFLLFVDAVFSLLIFAYSDFSWMLGENTKIPMFTVPAFPGGEQPVWVLFKSVTEVASRDFKAVGRQR